MFEIGIYHGKHEQNIGTLWRSAWQLGASGIFTIGKRYQRQASDTPNVIKQIPLRHFETLADMLRARPVDAPIVGVEMGGRELIGFAHPRNAVYLLGAEDHGLGREALDACNLVVSLPALRRPSFNVAVAGSIVLYDRFAKGVSK